MHEYVTFMRKWTYWFDLKGEGGGGTASEWQEGRVEYHKRRGLKSEKVVKWDSNVRWEGWMAASRGELLRGREKVARW